MIKNCKWCGKEFDNILQKRQFGGHIVTCKMNPNKERSFYKALKTKESRRIHKLKENNCLYCNHIIKTTIKENKKYCNRLCAIYHRCKDKPRSEAIKQKISKTLLSKRIIVDKDIDYNESKYSKRYRNCINCGISFEIKSRAKLCNQSCRKEFKSKIIKLYWKSNREIIIDKMKKRDHPGWKSRKGMRSFAEIYVENYLKFNNINNWKPEFIIKKKELGLNSKGSYFLDFYFEDLKIDLEIDGRQHEDRKEHDNFRDKLLSSYGIKVFRIKYQGLKNKEKKDIFTKTLDQFIIYLKSI